MSNSFKARVGFEVVALSSAVEICAGASVIGAHIDNLKNLSDYLDSSDFAESESMASLEECRESFKDECKSLFEQKGTLKAKTMFERLNYNVTLKELGEKHEIINKVAMVTDGQISLNLESPAA